MVHSARPRYDVRRLHTLGIVLKGNKFGAFGGVFTPSILTILGVIMYMRLPWIVGNAGLQLAIGIIVVAHVISITTGLSVSSIATDKSVQAGGPYYMISRSLGLPLGGTLGLALCVGLALSISLYIIGFSESFLAFWGWDVNPRTIRWCGTLTLAGLSVITLWSTALAIKAQYIILAAIVASLVSILAGPSLVVAYGADFVAPAATQWQPIAGAASAGVLFGIFFPAVTGFTAGVNMSGDLKDPRRAIPRGTLFAIGGGLATYIGLAVFFAAQIPAEQLASNPDILLDIALSSEAVVAGVWGATLSSALGSILGAPRILQALSLDRITPKIFGRGHGKTNEPRTALFVAIIIAELGILVAELDAIARIVSMFFMATYGFLNLSCAIEMWASPDFRPEFRIPKAVPLLGLATCVVVMIQLDLSAMALSVLLLGGIFAWLKRRELTLESGDTWEGVWSSVVRSGLSRLGRGDQHHRNWRPNVLLFSRSGDKTRTSLVRLGQAFVERRGVLTDFELSLEAAAPQASGSPTGDPELPSLGVFHQRIPVVDDKLFETMVGICRYHGYAGIEPNIVMMDMTRRQEDPERFDALLSDCAARDLNVLLLALDVRRRFGLRRRVDLWAEATGGSLPLTLSLVRFLTTSDDWRRAAVRFLILNDEPSRRDVVYKHTMRLLKEARVEGSVKVIELSTGDLGFEERVRQESADADLTMAPLPRPELGGFERAGALVAQLGSALFVRAATHFEIVAAFKPAAGLPGPSPILQDPRSPETVELPALPLPADAGAAAEVSRFAEAHDELVVGFHDRCVATAYRHNSAFIERVAKVVRRYFDQVDKALSASSRRKSKHVARALGTLLFQSQKVFAEFAEQDLPSVQSTLERGIEAFLQENQVIRHPAPTTLAIERPPTDFEPDASDSSSQRWFKRQRRLRARMSARAYTLEVPMAPLLEYFLDWRTPNVLQVALRDFASHSYEVAAELGKVLSSLRGQAGSKRELSAEMVITERDKVLGRLAALTDLNEQRRVRHRLALRTESRRLATALSEDLQLLDVLGRIRWQRKVPRAAHAIRTALPDLPAVWFANQSRILGRSELALRIAAMQHRLATSVQRTRGALTLRIQNGIARQYEKLRDTLVALNTSLHDGGEVRLKLSHDFSIVFDDSKAIAELLHEIHAVTGDLPESLLTVSDDAIAHLHDEQFDDVEVVEVSVRRLVQFLIEAELVGHLQSALANVPIAEQRAIGVAQDVVRLISFNLTDLDSAEERTEDLALQLTPVVENGIARVDAELERLQGLAPDIAARVDRQLAVVLDRTEAYAITGAPETLSPVGRGPETAAVLAGVGRGTRHVTNLLKDAITSLIYRRSAEVLRLQRLGGQGETQESVVDGVLGLVSSVTPRPAILQELPFYYHQLFLGKSAVNEAFWVGREAQLQQAARAVERFRGGHPGALIVTGAPRSGKASFCQFVAGRHFDAGHVFQVYPMAGGSVDTDAFAERFGAAVGFHGDWPEIFQTLPEPCAVVLHGVERWWQRSYDGTAVLDLICDLVDRYSDRCLFVLHLSTHAFELIDRLLRLSDRALAVVECGPVDAKALRDIVMLRHRSTGLRYELHGRAEEDLAAWRLASVFTRHFAFGKGRVGTTLQAWVSHIDGVENDTLAIRLPSRPNTDVLYKLRMRWVALLCQLVLHREVTFERLLRITGLSEPELRADLDPLRRMGLVTESAVHGSLQLNHWVEHLVVDHLIERGILT